jgi:hypothetical protein
LEKSSETQVHYLTKKLNSSSISESSGKIVPPDVELNNPRARQSETNCVTGIMSGDSKKISLNDLTENNTDVIGKDVKFKTSLKNTCSNKDVSNPSNLVEVEGIGAKSGCQPNERVGESLSSQCIGALSDKDASESCGTDDGSNPAVSCSDGSIHVDGIQLGTGMPGEVIVLTCLLRAR